MTSCDVVSTCCDPVIIGSLGSSMSGRCICGLWRPLSAELRQAESIRLDMKVGRFLATKRITKYLSVTSDWSISLLKTLSRYTPSLYSTLILLTLYHQLRVAGGIPDENHSRATKPDTQTDTPVNSVGSLTSAWPSDDSWPNFVDPRWMVHGANLSGLQSMIQVLENNINHFRDTDDDRKVDEDTLKILLYEAMLSACLEKYRHLEDDRGKIHLDAFRIEI